ncbi:MAG: hypothetical protein GEEBNDBF_00583 [bacterium]|nr:hypothetical protein [bacterium]
MVYYRAMQVAIDTGGTFTDCLGWCQDGRFLEIKVPSRPAAPAEAILDGLRALARLAPAEPITRIVHGSTIATNALLEGTENSALLILPRGFEDLLELARQQRPDLYSLHPVLPPPAMRRSQVVGIPARLLADGSYAEHWSPENLDQLIRDVEEWGECTAIGICLLHAHRFPAAEQELAASLREAGLPDEIAITLSSDLSREAGEYERATTTAINARLLSPVGTYLRHLESAVRQEFPGASLEVVLSNGDALPAGEAALVPVRMLLSGPAGGVQFGWQLSQALDQPVITLDIGGTSTDVACVPAEPLVRQGGQVGPYPVRTAMLDIETIGAGGGSIIWLDQGGALQVGPQSAGAMPGPACYGRGGALPTLTDAHLLLGHLSTTEPLAGGLQLRLELAEAAFAPLVSRTDLSVHALASGAIAIANQRIAQAIRAISSRRGLDPTDCALVLMGGAGGLHGAGVAQLLGISSLVLPPHPGLASAHGLASCGYAVRRVLQLESMSLAQPLEAAQQTLRTMVVAAWSPVAPCSMEAATEVWTAHVRFAGQDRTIALPLLPIESLDSRFRELAMTRLGIARNSLPLELMRLELGVLAPRRPWPLQGTQDFDSQRLQEGSIEEDLLIHGRSSTTLIPAGSTLEQRPGLQVFHLPEAAVAQEPTAGVAVEVTLAADRLGAIAEEMAEVLEHLGHSSNIKDRRDLSTAIFDETGEVLAQGAHIPVHLGSMGASVAAARSAHAMQPGDAILLNSPFAGGTHLPDLTLVSCVAIGDGKLAYVASRAHHADIGGIAPGSMPLSSHADDEGLLIPPTLVARHGQFIVAELSRIAAASRQPQERTGDLLAQLAANQRGAALLQELVKSYGQSRWQQIAGELSAYGAELLQSTLRRWAPGTQPATVVLESDGLGETDIPLQVTATLREGVAGHRILAFDFTGTSEPVEGPVNCPRAVVLAAISFVLRCLMPPEALSMSGVLRNVEIHIPSPSLLDASYPAATAAGNVETSQKLVVLLIKALHPFVRDGLPRPSQGTMNNLLLGGKTLTGESYTYYETLAGGCGAGPHGEGASAVHSHMTNSRNTPIEVLESRFPLVIEQYALRAESGGWPRSERGYFGGLGVQRAYRFLTDATLTLLADWPRHNDQLGPKAGAAYLLLTDDTLEPLPSKVSREVTAGMILLLATPGGWAWDPPTGSDHQ